MERRLCLELERVIMPQRAEFPVDYINALSVGHKRYTSVNPAASGSFKVHSLVALWSCLLGTSMKIFYIYVSQKNADLYDCELLW